jgi:hypothetical protein
LYYLVCEKQYGGENVCAFLEVYSLTHVSLGSSIVSTHGSLTASAEALEALEAAEALEALEAAEASN